MVVIKFLVFVSEVVSIFSKILTWIIGGGKRIHLPHQLNYWVRVPRLPYDYVGETSLFTGSISNQVQNDQDFRFVSVPSLSPRRSSRGVDNVVLWIWLQYVTLVDAWWRSSGR